MNYFKELTSLRGIAVILVVLSHWFPKDFILNKYTENGILGVTLFFVLSGFLITGVLYKQKFGLESNFNYKRVIKYFYIRRSLRIFPIYYLVLLLVFVFKANLIGDSVFWHFFYLSNVYFYLQNSWQGSLSHFWSLSVEEQFYLFWPFFILLINNKYHVFFFIVGILISVFFKIFIITKSSYFGRFLLIGSIDSFCVGALFAITKYRQLKETNIFYNCQNYTRILIVLLFIFIHFPFFEKLAVNYKTTLYLFIASLFFGVLIDYLVYKNSTKIIIQIFNSKFLLFTGELSYGIYLFHNFIPKFKLSHFNTGSYTLDYIFENLVRIFILYFVSFLTYKFIEKPFLNLKERFNY